MSLSIYIFYVTLYEWFNIKWIPPPGSAVPHKQFFSFLCLSADSLSPLSYWCINGQKKAKSCMQTEHMHSLCFLESQSLRDTPGRLVKNILETQTFIPFASYLCGLSEPKCCDVALVFPREFCQSTGPLSLCKAPTKISYCSCRSVLINRDNGYMLDYLVQTPVWATSALQDATSFILWIQSHRPALTQ